jgi:hypothetical protein
VALSHVGGTHVTLVFCLQVTTSALYMVLGGLFEDHEHLYFEKGLKPAEIATGKHAKSAKMDQYEKNRTPNQIFTFS